MKKLDEKKGFFKWGNQPVETKQFGLACESLTGTGRQVHLTGPGLGWVPTETRRGCRSEPIAKCGPYGRAEGMSVVHQTVGGLHV